MTCGEMDTTGDNHLDLALRIDETVRMTRPDGWRGVQAREQVIKPALHGLLGDVAEVERIFLIIKAAEGILMATTDPAGRHRRGRGAEGHQERPPERPSHRQAGCGSPPRWRMSLDTIRVFAISKLGWIKQQQQKLREQERETPREYLDRESHYVWGKRYLLKVVEHDGPPRLELNHRRILLEVRPGPVPTRWRTPSARGIARSSARPSRR